MFRNIYNDTYFSNRGEKPKQNNPSPNKKSLKNIERNNSKKYILKKLKNYNSYTNFLISKEKNYLSNKIKTVRKKPVKPKINLLFIEVETKLLDYKNRIRKIQERVVSYENQKYKQRIFTKPALFCSTYYFGKEFRKEHDKLIGNIYKREQNNILPKINNKLKKIKSAIELEYGEENRSPNIFELNQNSQGQPHEKRGHFDNYLYEKYKNRNVKDNREDDDDEKK